MKLSVMSKGNHTNRIPVIVVAVLIFLIGLASVYFANRIHYAQIKEKASAVEETEETKEKEDSEDSADRDTLDALLDELQNLDNMLNEN